jgi:hypothetical protein
MFDTRNSIPLSSAVAGGAVARVGGSLRVIGVPGMAHPTASLPIYRGSLR